MRIVLSLLVAGALVASVAAAKEHGGQRGTIVSMTAVPCGSQGKRHKKTQELLCKEYVLRSETMEYHIRQAEAKHIVILPVGQETEFRIDKDRVRVRVPGRPRRVYLPGSLITTRSAWLTFRSRLPASPRCSMRSRTATISSITC